MSVDNPIIVTTHLPTIDQAKEILLSNIIKSEKEIQLGDKWHAITYHHIKFVFAAEGEVELGEGIHSVSIDPIKGSNEYLVSGKININRKNK